MDEKDKQIKELTDKVATLTSSVETATKERDAATAEGATLKKAVAEKDVIIGQKNQDLIAQRQVYKKLSERSKEELEAMTEAEKEALKRQEDNDTKFAQLEKENKEFKDKAVGDKRAAIIAKYAGKSPELKKLIEENISKVVGHDTADTDESIENVVKLANNMIGTVERNTIQETISKAEGAAGGEHGQGQNFADTPEGKAIFDKIAPLPPPAAIAKPTAVETKTV